jgi:hypothetical protein
MKMGNIRSLSRYDVEAGKPAPRLDCRSGDSLRFRATLHGHPSSPNSVELPFPSKEQAQGIIVAHLDYFRINEKEEGSIKPFTQDGIDALLAGQTVHPRATLSNAAQVVQHAADKKNTVIDAECVKAAGELKTETATRDFSEGIDGAI